LIELVSPTFAGQWGWLVTAMVIWVLNAFLAEEFLFRGVLLPKMRGVFGRLDWVANAVLNGLYFLHKPWMIPFRTVDALITAWPARRFRSNWMAVVVRGVEGALVLVLLSMGGPCAFDAFRENPHYFSQHQSATDSI
jgi:membrane protease YdiL (CAAX protease family)